VNASEPISAASPSLGHDPFAPHRGGGNGSGPDAGTAPAARPARRSGGGGRAAGVETLVVVMTALVVAATGAPLALAWWLIAPKVPIVVTAAGPVYANYETERFMAADGWFAALGAGTGLVAAVLCWLLVRFHRGPAMLAGLVAGSVGAAVLAAWLGGQIGRLDYNYLLRHAPTGASFYHPLDLGARGALLAQAVLAVFVYTLIAGCSRYPLLTRLRRHPAQVDGPRPAGRSKPRQSQAQQQSPEPVSASFPVPSAPPDAGRQQPWPPQARAQPEHTGPFQPFGYSRPAGSAGPVPTPPAEEPYDPFAPR
jgi:hypothetical protein